MTRRESRHTAAERQSASDLRKHVGSRINALRIRDGLTYRQLGALIDIDARLIQKHTAGDNMPGEENLLRYARAFNVPVAWFFQKEAA